MNKSKIEWTEKTWNPMAGCTKISPGCKHCYAESMAKRLQGIGVKGYENGFKLTLMPNRLEEPVKVKQPTKFFVNSMSDLFHEDVPFEYIDKVFSTIRNTPRHIYQILTKRAEVMANYFDKNNCPKNAWLGVSVENIKHGKPRIDFLRKIPAKIKFISAEPLLEDLGELDFTNIDWVIVGGESGNKARPMKKEWVVKIKEQCKNQNIAFFFKQWGTWGADGVKRSKKKNGRILNGNRYDEYPEKVMI